MATTIQFADEITVGRLREATSVRWMARLSFAAPWIILFTGPFASPFARSVRKWIFPRAAALYLLQNVPMQDVPMQDKPMQDKPMQDKPMQDKPMQDVPMVLTPMYAIIRTRLSARNHDSGYGRLCVHPECLLLP